MDGQRFDSMTKVFANRRAALRAGGAGLVATVAAPLVSGLAQDATPDVNDCPAQTPEDLQQLAETFVAAVNAKDTRPLEGLFHDGHVHDWAIGDSTIGSDAYFASLNEYFDAFDDYSFTAEEIFVAGEVVIVRYTASGTQVREYHGFPATDQHATWSGIGIFYVQCGQFLESWFEGDHLDRLQQHGHIPQVEATPEQ